MKFISRWKCGTELKDLCVAIDLYDRLKEEISSEGWSRKDSLYFEVITIRNDELCKMKCVSRWK